MASEDKQTVSSNNDDPYECTECSKTFSYKKTLARHVRNKHTVGKPCICEYCKSRFNDKWAMGKHIASTHMKKHHVLICPICHYKDSKVMIDIHFASAHNIILEEERLEFSSLDEFEEWKNKIEKSTIARYVVNQKFKKKNGAERIIYNCHRSGFFKPRGKNKRKIKSQGTNKIMGFCPARLEFEGVEKGRIQVHFVKTHVGHENDVEKVFSQYEMRRDFNFTKKPVSTETSSAKQLYTDSVKNIETARIPVHLISNYCHLVEGGTIPGLGEIKPILVSEFSFGDNDVISIIRTHQDVRDDQCDLMGDFVEVNSPIGESATLHSATVINVNSITTVDLNGDDDVTMSNVLSEELDKHSLIHVQDSDLKCEGLQGLGMEDTNGIQCDAFDASLDLNKLLSGRLPSLSEVKLPAEESLENLPPERRPNSVEPFPNDDVECVQFPSIDDTPKVTSEIVSLLDIPATSVIISSETAQLAEEKQVLIDKFRNLIEAVETRELLWEMIKICVPAMEIMKTLSEQNVYDNIPFKPEK